MSTKFFLVLLPVWLVYNGTEADDMKLMNDLEIAELIDQWDGAVLLGGPGSLDNRKTICILDINGNIIRQTAAGDQFPYKNPVMLEVLLNRSLFLTEIDGIYYYLYDFSQPEKKIFLTGNFFSEIFI